jgi:type IV pilus assembly protein PilA
MLPELFVKQQNIQRSSIQGFTLIELLVTIIIVGVLAAIAAPSFLGQIGKSRGTEAKSMLGSINRAQQAYRLENGTMAQSLSVLNSVNTAKFYSYSVTPIDANNATTTTITQQPDLKSYSARIQQANDSFLQIICESRDTVASGFISPTSTSAVTCSDPGYQAVD